jgi:hypothetical protein
MYAIRSGGVLKACSKTFENYLRHNKKTREAWENGREEGRASLRRLQWRSAEHSVAMQIWLGKQFLGQTDKQEQSGANGGPVREIQVITGVPRAKDGLIGS